MGSLRNRLLKSSLLIAIPPVVASAVIGMVISLGQIQSDLTDRLQADARGAELALSAMEAGIRIRAQAAVRNQALERSLQSSDRLATLDWAEQALPLLGVDRVTVVGRDGRVVARGHLPTSYGDAVANEPADTPASGIGRGEGGLAIQAWTPIRSASDEVIGSLKVEKAIDYVLLGDLKKQFGLDFTAWDGERLQATTFTTALAIREAQESARRARPAGEVGHTRHHYQTRAAFKVGANGQDATLWVSVRLATAQALTRRLTWLTILVVLGMAAVTSAGAVFSARRIVQPIRRLVRATEEAAEGNLDVPIDIDQKDEIGELASRFSNMLDRRREVERELRETQADLESRVVARSEALRKSEEHLRQARQLEALGRLAGGVAHDFNNVLTVIIGYSDFLADQIASGSIGREAQQAISEVKASAGHAAALTRQLLAFSRRQVAQPSIIDLGRTIRQTERMLRRLLAEDVALEISIADNLAPIRGDPAQVAQVVVNLVNNAGDALPKGGTIRIRAFNTTIDATVGQSLPEVAPGAYVALEVEDSGTGMDQATLERVFEPFFTTKPLGKGTGMGLAIVHGIVSQIGAHTTVVSSPGAGTTFRILFPVPSERTTEPAPASAPRPIAPGHETLLLCEDDPSVRALIAKMLRGGGYSVLVASSGEQALMLGRDQPDIALLITDVVMPGTNGVELARTLRQLLPRVQVLYVSGYTSDILDTRADLGSADVLLEKPITRDVLLRKVREMLDNRAQPSPSKDTKSPLA